MILYLIFVFTVLLTALNVILYVSHHNPGNLVGAIFCGACALFDLILAAKVR